MPDGAGRSDWRAFHPTRVVTPWRMGFPGVARGRDVDAIDLIIGGLRQTEAANLGLVIQSDLLETYPRSKRVLGFGHDIRARLAMCRIGHKRGRRCQDGEEPAKRGGPPCSSLPEARERQPIGKAAVGETHSGVPATTTMA